MPGVVIVGCTGDSGVGHHDENAREAGQDLVLGKPMPHGDQLAQLLSRARDARRPAVFVDDEIADELCSMASQGSDSVRES